MRKIKFISGQKLRELLNEKNSQQCIINKSSSGTELLYFYIEGDKQANQVIYLN